MRWYRRAKDLAEALALAIAVSLLRLLQLRSSPFGIAVAYHAVDDRRIDARRALVAPIAHSTLRRHLRFLSRAFQLVPASQLRPVAARHKRGGRYPACLTFDDDLAQHESNAMPELAAAKVQGTFFLCGASLAEPHSFWWERLDRAVERSGRIPDTAARLAPGGDPAAVAAAIQSLEPTARDRLSDDLLEAAGPDPADAGIRAAAVRHLCRAGHEVGFHTRRHDDLTALTDDALAAALTDGRAELEAAAGRPITALAYPHGAADSRVAAAAAAAGFSAGFTLRPAAVDASADPMLAGRVLADGLSTLGLALRCVRALALRP